MKLTIDAEELSPSTEALLEEARSTEDVFTFWIDMITSVMADEPHRLSYGKMITTMPGWRDLNQIVTLEALDEVRDVLIKRREALPDWSGS